MKIKNNQLSGVSVQLFGRIKNFFHSMQFFFPKSQTPKAKRWRFARAFTLIETFIAVTVLLVSLVGPLSIAAQSLRLAYYARDQVTAFYLAQEAVEYVRAKRDQNYLATNPWLTGISDCVNASCVVDFPNFSHTVCSAYGSCPPVYVSTITTLYNESAASGPASPFTRVLSITPVSGTNDEVIVKVTVSWVSVGINRSFQVTEHLFNWAG